MKIVFRVVFVKERLPKNDGDYWVYFKDNDGDKFIGAKHFSKLVEELWINSVIYWLEACVIDDSCKLDC